MNYMLDRFKAVYTPHECLSLDEGSLGWKGQLSFRVYNPMKPTTYSIKMYMVAEAKSGYILNLKVYLGEKSSIQDTVMSLMEPYLNKGYTLYMDNFYNCRFV